MTGGKDPKRHHFLPQMLLRRFTDAKGKLAYFTKLAPAAGVIGGKPKSLFAENHLYSVEQADGSRDVEFEKTFAKLEGETEAILGKIVFDHASGSEAGLVDSGEARARSVLLHAMEACSRHACKSSTLQNADANIEEVIADLLHLPCDMLVGE